MSITIKVIIEIVLVLITVLSGVNFWLCQKSPRFLGKTLSNYNKIKELYNFEKDNISNYDMKIPAIGFEANIGTWLNASIKTLDKVRNWLFVLLIAVGVVSFLLGFVYWLIIMGVYFLTSFKKVTGSAANNIYNDIFTVMNNVYHWNKYEPIECKEFCTKTRPQYLKNIYQVIIED
jgi:hypothetical protein